MSTILMDKKYQYRVGSPARILCTDAPGDYPVISINESGKTISHTNQGKWMEDREDKYDLFEIRDTWKGKLWVHETGGSLLYHHLDEHTSMRSAGWRLINVEEVES